MKKEKTIHPRFQGRAVSYGAVWRWELLVTLLNHDDKDNIRIESTQEFITKEAAIQNMKEAIQHVAGEIAESVGHKDEVKDYINLKTGIREMFEKKRRVQ